MSRRKSSRLTKTDINAICEMQRKIDAYEGYIIGLCGLIQHRGKGFPIVLLRDTPMDEWICQAWDDYICQMNPVGEQIKKKGED